MNGAFANRKWGRMTDQSCRRLSECRRTTKTSLNLTEAGFLAISQRSR